MTKKTGFIGLGIMGLPMADNLIKAGYELAVSDLDGKRVDMLVKKGAVRKETPAEIARECRVIITMLPNGPEVEQVVLGPSGLIETIQKDSIVIDMSSIAPPVTLKVGAELKKKGVIFIDAPVSGGEPAAIAGKLAIMVGGTEAAIEKVRPVLEAMGSSVVRVGDLGAGQTTKLVNQILVALHILAMGEAFVLAVKAGVDPEKVFHAIKGGLAGSNVLNAKIPLVLDRNFKPGFRIRLHQKDLNNALSTAQSLGLNLPVTALAGQLINSLVGQGKGENDHSGLVQAIEKCNDVEIRKSAYEQ
jgi:2-hydroxy-3-oxopropionate reductase